MPGMDAIAATRILSGQVAGTAVVMLPTHPSPGIVKRAIEAGARGYVVKDMGTEELVQAVRAAAAGTCYIARGLLLPLLDAKRSARRGAQLADALTATERNVLKPVVDGNSNAEIAVAVGPTQRTVETYRLRLMRKLGIENLPALVKFAIRRGVVSLD